MSTAEGYGQCLRLPPRGKVIDSFGLRPSAWATWTATDD